MKMSNSIVIRRPLEEVFAFMSNIEHEPQWRPNVMEVKVTSGLPLRQGSTYLYVVKMMNRQMRTEGKITAFEPNRGWSFEGALGTSSVKGNVAFEPANEGTKVTLGGETTLRGLLNLFAPIMRGMMGRQVSGDLQNLKKLLESGR